MDQNPKFTVEARVGALTVVSSGVLHIPKDGKLLLIFEGLEMEFTFRQDDQQSRWVREIAGNRLTWVLYNFLNPMGQGLLEPGRLGNVNEREFYVSFFVWTPNPEAGSRIVNYVFYLGEPIAREEPQEPLEKNEEPGK
jgi:hypothetical protein